MKKQEKNIQNKKTRNILIALAAVAIVIGYATFAQPLAYNTVLKTFNKVTDIFKPYDGSNSSDNSNSSGNGNNANDRNNQNNKNNNDNSINNSSADSNDQNDKNNTSGTTNPSSPTLSDKWNISFTKAIRTGIYGYAREVTPVSFDALSVNFNVALTGPDDKIVYEFTITNKGMLNAKLDKIALEPEDPDDVIEYKISGVQVGDRLAVGESTVMKVTIAYKSTATSDIKYYNKSTKIIMNYAQD